VTGSELSAGTKVRVGRLGSTSGWFVKKKYLTNRQLGATGTVTGYFAGHGGEVLAVKHDNGAVAAYSVEELRPI